MVVWFAAVSEKAYRKWKREVVFLSLGEELALVDYTAVSTITRVILWLAALYPRLKCLMQVYADHMASKWCRTFESRHPFDRQLR